MFTQASGMLLGLEAVEKEVERMFLGFLFFFVAGGSLLSSCLLRCVPDCEGSTDSDMKLTAVATIMLMCREKSWVTMFSFSF